MLWPRYAATPEGSAAQPAQDDILVRIFSLDDLGLLADFQVLICSVKSDSGTTVCRVNGEYTSSGLTGSKVFLDAWGRALFTLKRKPWSLHQTHLAYSREGELLFTAKSKFSFTKTLMTASFKNEYDDKLLAVDVTGKFTEGTAEMRLRDGRVLGRIGRHQGGSYTVEAMAGVDLALVTALAVAFNEGSQYGNKTAWTD